MEQPTPNKEVQVDSTPPSQTPTLEESEAGKLKHSRKIAIVICAIFANSLMILSFGATMCGGLAIGKTFGINDPSTATWIAASYPLTHGAFVLVSGRIGAIYGHKNILLLGGAWWSLWSLINGFCNSLISFSIARALTGIGAALVMPNALAIIGITFPPGRTRNFSFAFFNFALPVAGTLGVIAVSLFIHFAEWKWFFFFLAIFGTCVFSTLWLALPIEIPVDKDGRIDWIGAGLGLSGLILFNFAWNQAPAVGWFETYEFIILLSSIGIFLSFGIWEHKYASQPIMPLRIWTTPSFFPLVIVVTFSIMAYSTALWYMVAWQQIIRRWTILELAAGIVPIAVLGSLATPVSAWLIPRVAAEWIMSFSALAILLSTLLLASMPPQQTYWAQVFPATVFMALCPDFLFTAAQIIVTNSVRRREQGVAGSLLSLLQLYGASIGLGFAGTVESNTNKGGEDVLRGYRAALYFGSGLAAVAFIVDVLFVRVPRDVKEGWDNEEDRAMSL